MVKYNRENSNMKEESTKEKSLRSVKWISFSQILPKIFAPITTILLVNVFVPQDYGIVGICGAFISFINFLQGMGIDDYLMRAQKLTDEKVNTAYWTNIGASLFFYFLLVMSSPIIALIYKQHDLIYFIPVLGISLIISAVGFVPRTILRKKMEFKKLFYINFAPLIISLFVTLPLGYAKLGPWAIVSGQVTLTLLTNAYFLLQSRWKPKFVYHITEVKDMFSFGKFIMFERIQEYIYANIDVFLIGFFIDIKTLGVYALAKSWSWLIFGVVTSPMTEILYPAFQKFIEDRQKMVHHFLEVERRMFFITVPIFLIIGGFATKAITVIFPARWETAGVVLAFVIIGDGIAKNFSLQRDLFKLIGRPDAYPKAFMINFIYTIVFYPLGAYLGLIPFLLVRTGNDVLYTVIQYYLTKNIFGFFSKDFFIILKPIVLSGVVILLNVILWNYLFNHHILRLNIITLTTSVLISVLFYLLVFYLKDRSNLQKFFNEGKIVFGLK